MPLASLHDDKAEEALYRAVESRDRRFDGRFVLAVVTTRIYCRPGCPAPLPRRKNMRFFPCAAAAEEAGFRACLRCRPEASPGSPAAVGTGATVSRALRLIGEGGLGDGVEALADRLGIGERHLRRLFAEQLGASPLSIARSRRLHFARKLIDETDLPMTEVALSAGFASTRRFNDEIRAAFGEAPTALREKHGGQHRKTGRREGDKDKNHKKFFPSSRLPVIQLRLAYKPQYDWASLIAFLAPRALPGVERVSGDRYLRAVSLDGCRGIIEVEPAPGEPCLVLRVPLSLSRALLPVVERAQRLFDLRADPQAIDDHLRKSPLLGASVAARPGLRVPGAWDGFEIAVRAVLGQQVSVKGATTLAGRLVARFGEPLAEAADGLTHLFPSPAALAEADLAAIGLPRARAEALRRLAVAARDGAVALDAPSEDPRRALTAIPGIGPWTAAYVAMRAFGEPDAFPSADLGLRRALGLSSAGEIERLVEPLRPFRAYAAIHLWSEKRSEP